MSAPAVQSEVALELLERMLTVELVARAFGFELPIKNELQHLWHSISWQRNPAKVAAAMVFVFEGPEAEKHKREVKLALVTIPLVSGIRTRPPNPDRAKHVLFEVTVDLSDLTSVVRWFERRTHDSKCRVCGRSGCPEPF